MVYTVHLWKDEIMPKMIKYTVLFRDHYENIPMLYTAIFHGCKKDNFQMKNSNIFLIFALKHRLWVLIRTALIVGIH